MANRKRLKKHKQSGMNRRAISGKRPMSDEQKEAQKKKKEIDRARTKTDLDKTRAKKLAK